MIANERRRALMRKFQAGSADRIRRVDLALSDLQEGRGTAEQILSIARELHTLKGESNMLGLGRVGAVTHAAETALLVRGGGLPAAETCARVQRALDVVHRAIQDELADPDATLDAALAALDAAPRAAGISSPPPSAAPVSAPPSRSPETVRVADRWVSIEAGRVDGLCEKIAGFSGDFRALSTRVDALLRAAGPAASPRDRAAIGAELRLLGEEFDRCRGGLDDLTDSAWSLRLSPVQPVLEELVRHAREIAARQGKRVHVTAQAGGAAIERTLLEELREPLLHLVRNAVDHGIEPPEERGAKSPEARLAILAETVGPSVVISVVDDGRGLDFQGIREAAVRLGLLAEGAPASERELADFLFVHGFSTRATVSELSGRGVGLDVVREKVEAFGGTAAIASEPGRGARFALTMPTTVSRERALVVEVGAALYGIGLRSIVELVRLREHPVSAAGARGERTLEYRGRAVPLRSLAVTLDHPAPEAEPWAMILDAAGGLFAFTLPRVVGELDLLRRPLDPLLVPLGYLGGSSTRGDGRLVLLLLVPGIIRRSEGRAHLPEPRPRARRRRVLVVEDAAAVRELLAEVLEGAGLDVEVAPDARAALAFLERSEPDLVLSDIDMPGMDGFALLRSIRARPRRLPVIMLSARGSDEDRWRAAEAGADAYLLKAGFQPGALLDAVGRFLS